VFDRSKRLNSDQLNESQTTPPTHTHTPSPPQVDFSADEKKSEQEIFPQILELRTKALYYVQPRSEKIWSGEQSTVLKFFGIANKHCILFSRAARNLGIYHQKQLKLTVSLRTSTVFCSAGLRTKTLRFVRGARKTLRFVNQSTCIFLSRAAKSF
jgi:hypothetical protein